jgi:hypothetical protein
MKQRGKPSPQVDEVGDDLDLPVLQPPLLHEPGHELADCPRKEREKVELQRFTVTVVSASSNDCTCLPSIPFFSPPYPSSFPLNTMQDSKVKNTWQRKIFILRVWSLTEGQGLGLPHVLGERDRQLHRAPVVRAEL